MDPNTLGDTVFNGSTIAGITTVLVSLLTMIWPDRPKGAALGSALGIGILGALVIAWRDVPLTETFTRVTYANIILNGLSAGAQAAGISIAQSAAEAARTKAAERRKARGKPVDPEPDPMNSIAPTSTPTTPPAAAEPDPAPKATKRRSTKRAPQTAPTVEQVGAARVYEAIHGDTVALNQVLALHAPADDSGNVPDAVDPRQRSKEGNT